MELIRKSDAIHAVLHNEGQAAVAAVQEIEAEDVAPVVHGEWHGGQFDFYCSQCGVYQNYYTGKTNYCPNCGAKMKGEQK